MDDIPADKLQRALESLEAEKFRRALELPEEVDAAVVYKWLAGLRAPGMHFAERLGGAEAPSKRPSRTYPLRRLRRAVA